LPSEDDSLARALRSCHSQPFSFVEVMNCSMTKQHYGIF
jgi:hypothetical protein